MCNNSLDFSLQSDLMSCTLSYSVRKFLNPYNSQSLFKLCSLKYLYYISVNSFMLLMWDWTPIGSPSPYARHFTMTSTSIQYRLDIGLSVGYDSFRYAYDSPLETTISIIVSILFYRLSLLSLIFWAPGHWLELYLASCFALILTIRK